MLCTLPASWLSNSIENAASAGALRSLFTNWVLRAASWTTVAPGAGVAAGEPEGDAFVNSSR